MSKEKTPRIGIELEPTDAPPAPPLTPPGADSADTRESAPLEPLPVPEISDSELEALSDAERAELLRPFINRFVENYLTFETVIPGFRSVSFKGIEQISLYPIVEGKALTAGNTAYAINPKEKDLPLYRLEFHIPDTTVEQLSLLTETGETEVFEDGSTATRVKGEQSLYLEVTPHPMTLPDVDPDRVKIDPGHVLTLMELCLLGALHTAVTKEEGTFIFRAGFKKGDAQLPGLEDEQGSAPAFIMQERKTLEEIVQPRDAVTGALYEPHRRTYIQPQNYFSGEPILIPTGSGRSVSLTIFAPDGTSIDADPADYLLSSKERDYVDAAFSYALKGYSEVSGANILKAMGVSNPYQASAATIMNEAFSAFERLTRTLIVLDTRNDYATEKADGKPLTISLTRRPIVNAELTIKGYGEGEGQIKDFSLHLFDTDPAEAFTTHIYGKNKGHFATLPTNIPALKPLKLRMIHRKMLNYTNRQITAHKPSNTILYETMFENLGIPGETSADKKRRERLKQVYRRILDAVCQDAPGRLFESYRPVKEGRKTVGVEITPLEERY